MLLLMMSGMEVDAMADAEQEAATQWKSVISQLQNAGLGDIKLGTPAVSTDPAHTPIAWYALPVPFGRALASQTTLTGRIPRFAW